MLTVAATDLKNRLGQIIDLARREPVLVQTHGRPMVVILDHAEFTQLVAQANAQMAVSVTAPSVNPEVNRRLAALMAIQNGEFTRIQPPDEPLFSEAFAAAKAEEQAREDRRWT